MPSTIDSFHAAFDREALDDLQRRLAQVRWPDRETVTDWSQGTPLAYARELATYWATDYDFERVPRLLNQWPQHLIEVAVDGDSYGIHCIHQRSAHPQARPLLLTHGWPGSVLEFYKIIDALTDPESHGGSAADAFHVIAPSLPGYGFSHKPTHSGTSVERIADIWDALMSGLGYERYYAQGGDWGAVVTCALGLRHSEHCAGININMVVAPPDPETLESPSELELAALAALERYSNEDSGYSKIQSTRPQTQAYGLADSPVGQLAWIVDKFWSWTDCERDGVRHPENAVSRDEILDTVMLYWMTNSAASSGRLYWESFNSPNLDAVPAPMGGSLFPRDIFLASERWARKRFPGLCYWHELPRGGHFAALEEPELFIGEMRACFRVMDELTP